MKWQSYMSVSRCHEAHLNAIPGSCASCVLCSHPGKALRDSQLHHELTDTKTKGTASLDLHENQSAFITILTSQFQKEGDALFRIEDPTPASA